MGDRFKVNMGGRFRVGVSLGDRFRVRVSVGDRLGLMPVFFTTVLMKISDLLVEKIKC